MILNRHLRALLRRLGLGEKLPPTGPQWVALLAYLNDHFRMSEEEKHRLTRSLEIHGREVQSLYKELVQERERLSSALACLDIGFIIFDKAGQVSLMNAEAEQYLGWTESEGAQRNLLQHLGLEDPSRPGSLIQLLSSGQSLGSQCKLRTKSGQPFETQVQLQPVLREGSLMGSVLTFETPESRASTPLPQDDTLDELLENFLAKAGAFLEAESSAEMQFHLQAVVNRTEEALAAAVGGLRIESPPTREEAPVAPSKALTQPIVPPVDEMELVFESSSAALPPMPAPARASKPFTPTPSVAKLVRSLDETQRLPSPPPIPAPKAVTTTSPESSSAPIAPVARPSSAETSTSASAEVPPPPRPRLAPPPVKVADSLPAELSAPPVVSVEQVPLSPKASPDHQSARPVQETPVPSQAGSLEHALPEPPPPSVVKERLSPTATLEPSVPSNPEPPQVKPIATKSEVKVAAPKPVEQPLRILLVEDEPVSQLVTQSHLEKLGHDCVIAVDANEAIRLYQRQQFDAIISSYLMPGMNGVDLCRRIREDSRGGYSYFILLTAVERKEEAARALEAGVDAFLTKPLDPNELAVRLKVARGVQSRLSRVYSEIPSPE